MKPTTSLGIALPFILTLAIVLFVAQNAFSQTLTQTIRGKITDFDSKSPIIGANIIVIGSDPFIGASSDINGDFRLEKVPIGRVNLRITYLGYEEKTYSNLLVGSAKEIVLQIEMTESVTKMNEIQVTASKHKAQVINEMATTSTRLISVEETSRYAGSFNDPGRMVSSFAGVVNNGSGDNTVVVRGNSPTGIQWKMEGMEIPNPNHFSEEGSTGGPISILNGAMLANSEFLTGAFAPEYGNATAGVFDMRLRNGNNEKNEYMFSFGVLGTDITAEGPLKKGYAGSFLFNYRYSSLAILDNLKVVDFNGVPKYQDGSFKLNLPTKNAGHFTLYGLGGKSNIHQSYYDSDDETKLVQESDYSSHMAVAGINHVLPINKRAFFQTGVAFSTNGHGYDQQTLYNQEFINDNTDQLNKNTIRAQGILNYKLSAKNKFKAGIVYNEFYFKLKSDFYDQDANKKVDFLNQNGHTGLLQNYISWKYHPTEKLDITAGVHYLRFMLNGSQSVEPRVGAKYKIGKSQYLTGGFGVHSKLQTLITYFAQIKNDDGSVEYPNRKLGLPKANHYVVGYENNISSNLHLKIEAYYQSLYNIPVSPDILNKSSMINQYETWTTNSYVNKGTGENYGLEFTFERFFQNHFFYMFTASVYESKYSPLNGEVYNTKFNNNYAGNFLFGKEIYLGDKTKNKMLLLNSKVLLIGGERSNAIDLEKSREAGHTIFNDDVPFNLKNDDIFQLNLTIGYRKNNPKVTHEFKIDIQNITNNQAVLGQYYNSTTDKIESFTQLAFLPNILYRIEF